MPKEIFTSAVESVKKLLKRMAWMSEDSLKSGENEGSEEATASQNATAPIMTGLSVFLPRTNQVAHCTVLGRMAILDWMQIRNLLLRAWANCPTK